MFFNKFCESILIFIIKYFIFLKIYINYPIAACGNTTTKFEGDFGTRRRRIIMPL